MRAIFKGEPGKALELFPENIFDKIPANHPVRLIEEVVDNLDISDLLQEYKGGGTSSYHPRMMLKVLFFSYFSNVYSCRKIAKSLEENINFMYISGNSTPDFRTINHFRTHRLQPYISDLFGKVVKMLVEMGYISLNVQYIDGTKIEAVSNRYTFVWRGSVEKNKAKLELKIQSVLEDINNAILSDNQELNKEELPKEIDSSELKKRIEELNQQIKEPNKGQKKQLKQLETDYLPRLERYERDLEILGDRNSYSKTDPDATFMRMKEDHMKNGQLKPAYNPQISTENQFITHISIHQTTADTTTLETHLNGFEAQYGKQSKEIVADAGYGSEENYAMLEQKEIEAYVKFNYFHKEQKRKMKNDPFLAQNLFYNAEKDFFVCPMGQKMQKVGKSKRTSKNGYVSEITYYQAKRCEGCPLRGMCHDAKKNRIINVNHELNRHKQKARELLTSEIGLEHRSKRPIEVEAVFGQLKSNNQFNRFSFRGISKVFMEFALMSIGHNMRKMVKRAA